VLDDRQQRRFADEIDLVQRDHRRRLTALDQFLHEPVARAGARRDIHDEHDHVHFAQRVERRVHHPPVHPMHGLVDSRRVDEHQLRIGHVLDPENPVPRRLGLVGHDRQLLPDELVQQRGLAGIGAPDERDMARLHADSSSAGAGSRQIRTL
jgi:hypothetical protein